MAFLENIPIVFKKTDNALCGTGELRAMTVELGQEEYAHKGFKSLGDKRKNRTDFT